MIIPDVNLLLYAVISGFPQHRRAHAWFEGVTGGPDRLGLTAPAMFGFLRIATSPRILESPLSVSGAVGYIHQWSALPSADILVPGPRHLDIALSLVESAGTAGNLTTDAQLAAYALEYGAELHSNDTDFGRFSELRWINPLA